MMAPSDQGFQSAGQAVLTALMYAGKWQEMAQMYDNFMKVRFLEVSITTAISYVIC
jgi:hypothetical protein